MADLHLVGLIGFPVGHSLSPRMQQAAFDALGISARYVLWETPPTELPARVAALREPEILGANVTIPHKAAVPPLLDETTEGARLVGAVNTIVRIETTSGVRLAGHNTDVPGLRRALAELGAWTSPPGPLSHGERGAGAPGDVHQVGTSVVSEEKGKDGHRRMLVLGAGGSARAALAVARLEGAVVWVAARQLDAARALLGAGTAASAGALDLADPARLAEALAETDVLINTTPAGMGDPDAAPLPLDLLAHLPADAVVFDLVYAPPETALVRATRARGLRASGGLPMLLYQGAEAFTLWTGRPAPVEAMRAAISEPH
ncbi:MAG TPA: shikimate dehydrogenase [Ktedonobacterales bacterium]|nr:shikimate dehydrogenase [Ktedonobacterales bacterium]